MVAVCLQIPGLSAEQECLGNYNLHLVNIGINNWSRGIVNELFQVGQLNLPEELRGMAVDYFILSGWLLKNKRLII